MVPTTCTSTSAVAEEQPSQSTTEARELQALKDQVHTLKLEKEKLKYENQQLTIKTNQLKATIDTPLHRMILKTTEDYIFFTGIQSYEMFTKLHEFVCPFVRRRWRGTAVLSTRVKRLFKASPKKFGPQRKLSSKDEFLLVLMKLRLGLTNKDLASRFGISVSLVSNLFTSWITAMDKTIGKILVFWPSKEQILASKPQRYRHMPNLVSIIDCSEIFIERPKNMDIQFQTWSDYKHHNTVKYLVSVAPNSAITYISPLYCGRISDKALTIDCGFLDLLDPYSEIMADKGFPIQKECDARRIYLTVPAGRRGAAQMSARELQRSKKVANLRILVEQVIRRMKTFRIIRYEMPISLLPIADKIVHVIAGLCNLNIPIYKV